MNRVLPPFPALRAFESAARNSSFKAAAEELNVTQSAISHQIKSLEEFLGIALFRRGSRGVSLTGEGTTYLAQVGGLLDSLSSATERLRDQSIAGQLFVRSTPAFASRWLVPRIDRFHRAHPEIEVHLSSSLQEANFVDDGIDVHIRWGHVTSRDLHAEPIFQATRFPVASPALLQRAPRIRRPADLCKLTLLHNEVEDGWAQWFECAGVLDVEPDAGPRFDNCDLTLGAAAEGQGVALAYSALVTEDLRLHRLQRLFEIELPATVIYSFVCPGGSLDRPRVAAFRNWLISETRVAPVQDVPTPRAVGSDCR